MTSLTLCGVGICQLLHVRQDFWFPVCSVVRQATSEKRFPLKGTKLLPREHFSDNVRKRTFWHVSTMKAQISLCFHSVFVIHMNLCKMRPVKILIRLRESAGGSESSLGAHLQMYAYWRCVSILSFTKRHTSRKHTYIILTPLNPTFV